MPPRMSIACVHGARPSRRIRSSYLPSATLSKRKDPVADVIVRTVSHSVASVTGRPTTGPPSDILTVPRTVPVCALADWLCVANRSATAMQ